MVLDRHAAQEQRQRTGERARFVRCLLALAEVGEPTRAGVTPIAGYLAALP